jgi:hypothetical protein
MARANRRRTDNITIPVAPREESAAQAMITDQDVALHAYERYRTRGGEHGYDLEDWLRSERELRHRAGSTME